MNEYWTIIAALDKHVAEQTAELQAKLSIAEAERDQAVRRMQQGWIQVCDTSIADMQAKLEVAEKEAEWYQHLKKQFAPFSLDANGNHSWQWRGSPSKLRGFNLDKAVAAAIEAEKGGE